MLITMNHMAAAGVKAVRAALFLDPLNAALALFGIHDRTSAAALLAQMAHETGGLAKLEEDLCYTNPVSVVNLFKTGFDTNKNRQADPAEIEVAKGYLRQPAKLANRAYANRGGNGNEASGDGWKFRGRGGFHLTFHDNYAAMGKDLGRDYVASPDLVMQPTDACLTSVRYWQSRGLTQKLQTGGIDAVTRAINGDGMVGAADRRERFNLIMG